MSHDSGETVAEQLVWPAEGCLTVMFLPVGTADMQQTTASVHLVALK